MKKICIELKNNDKIYVDLFEETAPITVANFCHLIDINFYEDTIFHRNIKGFMCQGGAYTMPAENTIGEKHVNYTIPGEFTNNGFKNDISHVAGTISMARTDDPNSANTQFFICDADSTFLDDNYASFGRVSDEQSLELIKKLAEIPTADVGQGFTDFPTGDSNNFTIKTISFA